MSLDATRRDSDAAMRILVVDDERPTRGPVRERLVREGYGVMEAEDGTTCTAVLEREVPDLVLLDVRLPDTDGLRILKGIQSRTPDLPVIILTTSTSVDRAVEAMKLGAFDYVMKPFNMDELAITVRRALETAYLRRAVRVHVHENRARYGVQNLVGRSKAIRGLRGLIERVSRSGATTVLIRGESGTGKDLIAKAIHAESSRAEKPFMDITCTALQETLLESELFGHEKGSFTDAKSQKRGLFEMAHGGSVLLDEVGDMSRALQAKLLRVLEERSFRRIGGTQEIRVDIRVMSATNQDLERLIERKAFRADLYYRLNTVTIDVPPLRERSEDVAPLAEHFLRHFARELRRPVEGISEAALAKLGEYDWPGNVRELRNVIERAVLLGQERRLGVEDIPLGRPAAALEPGRRAFVLPRGGLKWADLERDLVAQALEKSGGSQTKAGKLLGMTRDQVQYRIQKYGLAGSKAGT
ncbi:MAG: sigma-54 dependent transcriptional regulator [Planctomycetales bacterium]|nr:sigma-54 dependent transcriptional regulator [Planctomycetales bacterium]